MSVRGAADEGGSFDPRYDRAFQRDAGGRDGDFRVSFDSPAAPLAYVGAEPSEAFRVATPDGEAAVPPNGAVNVVGASEAASERSAAEAAWRARAARRWLGYSVAIACVAGACMAFGIVLVVTAYSSFAAGSVGATAADRLWPELAFQFGPGFFVVGLAAAVGLLFLHALRWRPER
ncbi:hypothetical protein [Planctomonas psychrotolerans]|uniref:hypothetical protein n=1 Tax=Planctomonas psychrotolerans TaxID=2528712 RepID=UPI00123A7275|nr:hypothetical protein [Planctomonas psychrotolerans]